MDWFRELTGFAEVDADQLRTQLFVDGDRLRSRANGRSYGIGQLTTPSLGQLRALGAHALAALGGNTEVAVLAADVRELLGAASRAGATFQVASQFNLLEMISAGISPEMGVTRYEGDPTQGPACAMAAGAATIYRNYFLPLGDGADAPRGQTEQRQIDCAADLHHSLCQQLALPPASLWAMKNGYALPSAAGLEAVDAHLAECGPEALDYLRCQLRIGVHEDVEITRGRQTGHRVTQVFGSAMPVAYSGLPAQRWERLARLVLQASYEATLWAAVIRAARTANRQIYLTLLGGGAFGNPRAWILEAMQWALARVPVGGLQVFIVSYGSVPADLAQWVTSLAADSVPRSQGAAVRTSLTDPLQIAELRVPGPGGAGAFVAANDELGAIGITFCPGKQGDSVFGRPWRRDLATDLDAVHRWGARIVLTLIEDHEFAALGVEHLGAMVTKRSMRWIHLPIRDLNAPDARFEKGWAEVGPQVRAALVSGARVLVHCRGGLGRAGTVAARLLVELGADAESAIARVRAARPGAIETAAQEQYLLALAGAG